MRLPRMVLRAALPTLLAIAVTAVSTGVAITASPALADGCSVARAQTGSNPSYAQVAAAIDAASAKHHVPPALMRAIAWKESGWGQFRDGRAKVSPDCGVGIMQLTGGRWDYARLGRDFRYNVDAGAQVLAAKMRESSGNVPPELGSDELRVTENWYRATFRYNGWASRAEGYVDAVWQLMRQPVDGIRPYAPPLNVASPKDVIPGYRPTNGMAYVARLDGTWRSSRGTHRGPITRADYLAVAASTGPGRTLEGGQRSTTGFVARNYGWATWTPSAVALRTAPLGRTSAIPDSSWTSASTVGAIPTAVAPGATLRMTVPVRAAARSSSARVTESFVLVTGGRPLTGATASSGWSLHPAGAPVAHLTSVPAYVTDASTDSTAVVQLSAHDPGPGSGVARIELARRISCSGCDWTATSLRPGTTSARLHFERPGAHELKVRAVDRAGNFSAWSTTRQIVVPVDDRSDTISYEGLWARRSSEQSYLGTVGAASDAGSALVVRAHGTTFSVIGQTGPGSADLAISIDGVLVALVSPQSDTVRHRQLLWRGSSATSGAHVLRVEVQGSMGGVGSARTAPGDGTGALAVVDAIAVT